jgi:hypothetical protein
MEPRFQLSGRETDFPLCAGLDMALLAGKRSGRAPLEPVGVRQPKAVVFVPFLGDGGTASISLSKQRGYAPYFQRGSAKPWNERNC